MATLNKVQIIGRLGANPELRHTQSQKAVCNFSVATTFKVSGDKESTEWHKVQTWEKLAEICSTLLKKGSLVYIEGRLATRSWEAKDGTKQYTTEIIATNMQKLTPKDADGEGEPKQASAAAYDNLDEIPF